MVMKHNQLAHESKLRVAQLAERLGVLSSSPKWQARGNAKEANAAGIELAR